MYSTRFCPYCVRARRLLDDKGVEYKEIAVDCEPNLRKEMQRRSGRTSVPQVFIDENHVGGFVDLWALEQAGELDDILGLADPGIVSAND